MAKKQEPQSGVVIRPPVVVVMGHVDHGKTTLLDTIRKTQVAAKEVGQITQAIGAYQIAVKSQNAKGKAEITKKITFIDTPGHAAFQAMRQRGATAADIAVLVVAADDSVKPQTQEAIKVITEAGIPMIVAINKIDLPSADVNKVKKDLATNEIYVEGYGGNVPIAEISAKTGQGVDGLLDLIDLVAELEELEAKPGVPLRAIVIESRLDGGRGAVATVIVQQGTIEAGKEYYSLDKKFKVRTLINDAGEQIKLAGPSAPCEVVGLAAVPPVGSIIQTEPQEVVINQSSAVLSFGPALKLTESHEIPILLKANVAGSLEAIIEQIKGLPELGTTIRVVSEKVGDINESDVHFAKATNALIIGFTVKIQASARTLAEIEGVPYKVYTLIYELLEDLAALLASGMLSQEKKVKGKAEVLQIFPTEHKVIYGVMVAEGRLRLGETVQVLRGEDTIGSVKIKTLRHVKDDVREITRDMEAGVVFETPLDLKIGDVLQYSP